jgi:hypothetical protein
MRERRLQLDIEQAKQDLVMAGEIARQKYEEKMSQIRKVIGLKI